MPVGELALSSCACTDDGRAVAVGSWDNCIYFYSIECGMPRDGGVAAHDDAVSSLSLRGDKMLSGSWDSTVKVRIHTSGCVRVPSCVWSSCCCSSLSARCSMSIAGTSGTTVVGTCRLLTCPHSASRTLSCSNVVVVCMMLLPVSRLRLLLCFSFVWLQLWQCGSSGLGRSPLATFYDHDAEVR